MGTFGEKAGTFILTAIQVANDAKRIVEERVKGLVKEAMSEHEAEIASLRERLEEVERRVKGAGRPAETKASRPPSKPQKRRARKKVARPKSVTSSEPPAETATEPPSPGNPAGSE